MLKWIMGWWTGKEEEVLEESSLPYDKWSDGGYSKEGSNKSINKLNDYLVTSWYDCGKKRYIESLMLVSSSESFDDL